MLIDSKVTCLIIAWQILVRAKYHVHSQYIFMLGEKRSLVK